MYIWRVLGIEPTTDRKAIKEAYSRKIGEAHPEENPEEFVMLREAYDRAMKIARGSKGFSGERAGDEVFVENQHFDYRLEKTTSLRAEEEGKKRTGLKEKPEKNRQIDFASLIKEEEDITEIAKKVVDEIRLAGDGKEVDEAIKLAVENGLLLQNDFFHIITRDVVNSDYPRWKLRRLKKFMQQMIEGKVNYKGEKGCDYRHDRVELLVQEIDEALKDKKRGKKKGKDPDGCGCLIGLAIFIFLLIF